MHSGYPEKYRTDTLSRSFSIYDKMVQEDSNGTRPLYRPKDWNVVARRKAKEKKKYNWSTRGGHVAPIFVPPTPDSELANFIVHCRQGGRGRGALQDSRNWRNIYEISIAEV